MTRANCCCLTKLRGCSLGGPLTSSMTFWRASSAPRPLLMPSEWDFAPFLFWGSSFGPSDYRYASTCLVKFFCCLIRLAWWWAFGSLSCLFCARKASWSSLLWTALCSSMGRPSKSSWFTLLSRRLCSSSRFLWSCAYCFRYWAFISIIDS